MNKTDDIPRSKKQKIDFCKWTFDGSGIEWDTI